MGSQPATPGRFSDPGLLILTSLAAGPKHGYAITEDIAAFSGIRLEPGTLYGALQRLERRGWIAALPPIQRQHPYRLTAAGEAALRQQLATMRRVLAVGSQRLDTAE